MMALHVHLLGGGTADWEKPVQIGPSSYRATYQTYITKRFSFENGRVVHVRTRYEGVDDIELDSAIPVNGGFGHIEGVDEDGDRLYGRVDWVVEGEYEGGRYAFSGGTGKWEGVSGTIDAALWARPEDPDQVMPPEGPVRFWGFLEGEGELDVPSLDS
jgi:hypothetical protein